MARARMVANSICRDKTVNNLSDFACRLLFTWLITFADCEGRTNGDAELVKSMVFPRSRDLDSDQVEDYLQELNGVGLIIRYEARGDTFIWFPKFAKNQPGMRKDREPESEIPPPPSAVIEEYIRKFSVQEPEEFRISAGLREENGMEVKENKNGMEEESENSPPPPSAAADSLSTKAIWLKICPDIKLDGVYAIVDKVIKDSLKRNNYRPELVVAEGVRFYQKWCNTKGKNGRFYRADNIKWIEWWESGAIPPRGERAEEVPGYY